MDEVTVRPTTHADVEGLNRTVDAVCRERRFLVWTRGPELAAHRHFVERNIAHRWPQFVAQVGEALVGWCDIVPREIEGFEHSASLGMGLLRPWRGRGIGSRLLGAALERAEGLGMERIELEVFADNVPAVRLYENHGFVEEGRKPCAHRLDGVYRDVLLMARLLVPCR